VRHCGCGIEQDHEDDDDDAIVVVVDDDKGHAKGHA